MTEKMFIPKDKNLLDPKKDSIFKTIFASAGESSRIALKSLVTAIIGYEPQSVEVINNELSKNAEEAKDIRLDLQCKMEDGSRIDVEIQTCPSGDDLRIRSLYYGCRMLSSISMKGRSYRSLPKVYQVMFTDFRLFSDSDDYMRCFHMKSEDIELTDRLQIIFIQMPLFKEDADEIKNLSEIEKWIIFLRDSTDKDKRDLLNRIIATNKGIKEAGALLMTISKEEREWAINESIYKGQMDRQAEILSAHEKGKEEGRTEGKIEVARGMKVKNIPIDVISEITGLATELVAAL